MREQLVMTVPLRAWVGRRFQLGLPPDAIHEVLSRVRGTPARLEELVRSLGQPSLTMRLCDAWSIQEHVGHLLDLETLWAGRMEDFAAGLDRLRPADMDNRKTHEANHNQRPIAELLLAFRSARASLVASAEALSPGAVKQRSLHPRLGEPMTVVDHLFFVAEHDDHHLARILAMRRMVVT